MTQSTILAVGTTAATSSDVTVAAGSSAVLGIFATTGPILAPDTASLAEVVMDTPGSADAYIETLTTRKQVVVVSAPEGGGDLVFRVVRAPGVSLGVFKNVT